MPRIPRVAKYGLMVIAVAALILRLFVEPSAILFSSNTSPDGLFVAENYLVDACTGECATGRIVIRNTSTGRSEKLPLAEPLPGIFFRWTDANHLVIFQDELSKASPIAVPDQVAGIHVTRDSYPNLSAAAATAQAKRVEKRFVLAKDVTAAFSRTPNPHYMQNGTTCELRIVARDAREFQEIGVSIIATTGLCQHTKLKGRICGGMESRYWVAHQHSQFESQILTSADIDGAGGYGILPTGADHKAIRGQLLESSASHVVRALRNASFAVNYNFDFVERSVKYEVPTSPISTEIAKFQECVKDTDFEWLKHIQ